MSDPVRDPGLPPRAGPRRERQRFGWVTELVVIVVLIAPVLWILAAALDLPEWIEQGAMWLTFFLIALIVVALVARPFLVASTKRRWKRFAAEAGRQGLGYTAEDPPLATRWRFDPFGGKGTPRARNVVRGRVGERRFVAFDYSLHRPREAPDEYSVLLVSLPGRLPKLKVSVPFEFTQAGVTPRRLDIDIEDDEFNRRYRVTSYDRSSAARKYAVDVLNPRAVEWMLSVEPFEWAIEEDNLVTWGIGWFDPARLNEQVLARARVLAGVADNIPAFVYRQHAGR